MKLISGITIIGSGNVAWHLSHIFQKKNIRVNYIIGRNKKDVTELGESLKTSYSTDFNNIPDNTDLVLLCISDGTIREVSDLIKNKNLKVAHTAGSVALSVFSENFKNAGVFYPFQTFSKHISNIGVNFPVCVEALNAETLNFCMRLAKVITDTVVELDSEKRRELHLSGVIANNFSNFLYTQSFEYLQGKEIDVQLLLPIINQTVNKLKYSSPKNLQTGPALRGSKEVINYHIEMLGNNKDLQDIYKLMSEKISQYYNNNDE